MDPNLKLNEVGVSLKLKNSDIRKIKSSKRKSNKNFISLFICSLFLVLFNLYLFIYLILYNSGELISQIFPDGILTGKTVDNNPVPSYPLSIFLGSLIPITTPSRKKPSIYFLIISLLFFDFLILFLFPQVLTVTDTAVFSGPRRYGVFNFHKKQK